MEAAAYYVALATVVAFPPVVLSWLLIHPFAARWRKLGPVRTYLAVWSVVAILMAGIYLVREPLLRVRFGVRTPLVVVAAALLVFSLYLRVRLRWQFSIPRLLGLPELSAGEQPGKLITQGIYSRVRHPRYLEGGFAAAALALFTNYLAVYLVLALYIPLIYLVVLFEERELRSRFGDAYERYCHEVPRFIPRLGSARRPANERNDRDGTTAAC